MRIRWDVRSGVAIDNGRSNRLAQVSLSRRCEAESVPCGSMHQAERFHLRTEGRVLRAGVSTAIKEFRDAAIVT
jgi:hypothetical protein